MYILQSRKTTRTSRATRGKKTSKKVRETRRKTRKSTKRRWTPSRTNQFDSPFHFALPR